MQNLTACKADNQLNQIDSLLSLAGKGQEQEGVGSGSRFSLQITCDSAPKTDAQAGDVQVMKPMKDATCRHKKGPW